MLCQKRNCLVRDILLGALMVLERHQDNVMGIDWQDLETLVSVSIDKFIIQWKMKNKNGVVFSANKTLKRCRLKGVRCNKNFICVLSGSKNEILIFDSALT